MSELSVRPNSAKLFCQDDHRQTTARDQVLMERIASGDAEAFTALIETHGQSLARLVGRLTAWHTDVEDILQDVWLKVWRQAGAYSGQGSLEGWLKRIAINTCRNHFRTVNSIKRKIENFGQQLLLGQDKFHYEASFEKDELDPGLQSALEELGRKDRELLVLFYQEELSGNEIAKLLNLKLETLHVRIHRARKKLKQILTTNSETDE